MARTNGEATASYGFPAQGLGTSSLSVYSTWLSNVSLLYLQKFENILAERDIPIYVPSGDDSQIGSDSLVAKKVLFSTFHQSKGLERKVVVIFDFSGNYFKYFGRDYDPNTCPVSS